MPRALKRLMVAALVTFPIGVVAHSQEPALHLSEGHLTLNGEPVIDGISITQSRFGFLFFYVPDRGLFTIASRPFDGGVKAGTFDGDSLLVELNGQQLHLQGEGNVLSPPRTEAWGRFDPSYHLALDEPMIGFGDSPEPPEIWHEQFADRD